LVMLAPIYKSAREKRKEATLGYSRCSFFIFLE
jgi:hypothetical protein